MATQAQCKKFIAKIAPSVTKYAKQYGFKICSFAIAQACLESGYGTSSAATQKKNIYGIGPGKTFSSWDACVKGYYTLTVLGKSTAAKNAKTLDEYYRAFVASGYLGGNGQAAYYTSVKKIIQTYNLTQYDNGKVATGYEDNKCEEFVQKALSYKGTKGKEWGKLHPDHYHPTTGWCADFVGVVANEVGIGSGSRGSSKTKTIIANHCGAHKLVELTKSNYKGVIHYSTANNYGYKPQRGDLINFRNSAYRASGTNYSTHIGIVVSYKDGVITTIEGNVGGSGGVVKSRKFKRKDAYVYRFCTPDWSKVGGVPLEDVDESSVNTSIGTTGVAASGDLFQDLNTREDATVREVCSLQTVYKKVKVGTKTELKVEKYNAVVPNDSIKLSIVNYSELFQSFWSAGAQSITSSSSSGSFSSNYDYSKLESKVRTVITYLVDEKGLNNAAACGIAGNIKAESSFRTDAVGDNGTSFGICQWHEGRGAAMKKMAGPNWSNNLTGQLDYLWYELENSYASVLASLKGVSNNESGAKKAADIFVRRFEIPANVDAQSKIRQANAVSYFKQIKSILKSDGKLPSAVDYNNLSAKRKAILSAAQKMVDLKVPYVWGGSDPYGEHGSGTDCSGLTQACYKAAGISIPRSSSSQPGAAPKIVAVSQAIPGDILWTSGHVGIFIGDGKTIEQYMTGKTAEYRTIKQFKKALQWNI